jgi:prenyl protein peptidase
MEDTIQYKAVSGSCSIGYYEALTATLLTTALYVGVLYLPWNKGDRDTPKIIMARIASVTAIAFVGEVFLILRVPEISRLRPTAHSALFAGASSAVMTLLFYSGHFLAYIGSSSTSGRDKYSFCDSRTRILAFRNYIAAPVIEEIVFRRQASLIWSCKPELSRVLTPAALFSLAHLHHVRTVGVEVVLVQLSYTLLFGVYSAYLFVRTESVFAPVTAHIICNYLELPDFSAIANHKRSYLITGLNVAAILAVFVLFEPITAWANTNRFKN